MKRRLQALACIGALLMSLHLMAQDTTGDTSTGGDTGLPGGYGGSTMDGNTGGTQGQTNGNTQGTTEGNANGGTNNNTNGTGGNGGTGGTGGANGTGANTGNGTGTGTGGQNGTGNTQGNGGNSLFGPNNGSGTGAEMPGGGGSLILPPSVPTVPTIPGSAAAIPGTTPPPTPSENVLGNNVTAPGGASLESTPATFSLPGGYGQASQSFTLGQGRLARPPFTLTLTVSQGYDDNIFSATAHPTAAATPTPGPTPPLEAIVVGHRINPPSPPTPILQFFRPKGSPTPPPAPTPLGVVGSPVSTASLALGIQRGTPRTIFTLDASIGESIYWNQPGQQTDYNGSVALTFVHKLTPRATLDASVNATYQRTPNFALINAPTQNNGGGGEYLNGFARIDLSYAWTKRISTLTSYSLDTNLVDSSPGSNLYESTYGTQIRYSLSARNTVDIEWRQTIDQYPSNGVANSMNTFYLVGLDSVISTRLHNAVSLGLEDSEYPSGGSRSLPYFETATTLGLPRSATITWTNRYGSDASQTADQQISSYRTGLTYSLPLSTKLVTSISIAYNVLNAKDTADPAGDFKQNQFQFALSAYYTISPRFSLNMSYTFLNLDTNQVNASYVRNQLFFGGSYTFK